MIIELFQIRQGTVEANAKQLVCEFKAWWHHGTAAVFSSRKSLLVTECARTQNVAMVCESFAIAFLTRDAHHFKLSIATWRRSTVQREPATTSKKGRSGRRRTTRTEENNESVRERLQQPQEQGKESITSRRNGLGLSQSTFSLITRLDWRINASLQDDKETWTFLWTLPRRTAFYNRILARPPRFIEDLAIAESDILYESFPEHAHHGRIDCESGSETESES